MDAIQEDSGDSMQCTQHPFKNNSPTGGICAICLQEKLGKLVSSSFPVAVFPTSSSPSPSFRSDITSSTTTTISSASQPPPLPLLTKTHSSNTSSTKCHRQYYSNRSRILYLLSQKKKYKKKDNNNNIIINSNNDLNKNLVFKRSKSTASGGLGLGLGLQHNYMEADNEEELTLTSPHKRGFWSFIHLQKHKQNLRSNNMSSDTFVQVQRSQEIITMEESTEAFDRKVSRSRSVGCGSRSFSGEFFDRISTGLGDCALRRVESQRDGHHKRGHDGIKERVKCGGLFSGFMVTSSSSSSSSSSYLVASNANGRVTSSVASGEYGQQHSRSRSWGWALASPMRAFSKREDSKKNQSPNLDAIPSLLSVRS